MNVSIGLQLILDRDNNILLCDNVIFHVCGMLQFIVYVIH